jgi:hypothetical protein
MVESLNALRNDINARYGIETAHRASISDHVARLPETFAPGGTRSFAIG